MQMVRSLGDVTRRRFIAGTTLTTIGSIFLPDLASAFSRTEEGRVRPCGPASKYRPLLKVAFARRKGEYGMKWPGQIYDGEAALKNYRGQILKTGNELGMEINMRTNPIHSLEEADNWIGEAKAESPDGLLVVTLDRQNPAWPTVDKAVASEIPTIVFSPHGTSFTVNLAERSKKEGVFICSTDDYNQVASGMKMIKAGATLRETRFLVIEGNEREDGVIRHIGTKLRYLPGQDFVDEYNKLSLNNEIKRIADEYIENATGIRDSSKQDVYNGVKSYLVAKNLLEREECDGITMSCLRILGPQKISLPCIAWSRMNDHGVPAACEADLEACVSHALVQYLLDRPGFQQDPVAETSMDCLIGAHCCCPTRLNGFSEPAEPYELMHHHGMRDATVRTAWRVGQKVTILDTKLSDRRVIRSYKDVFDENHMKMIVSTGEIVGNKSVPPSGGCVVAPIIRINGFSDVVNYPGMHQLFVYGDFKKELKSFCKLYRIKPILV